MPGASVLGTERKDLLAQVWPTWAVCGLYALGTAPTSEDTRLHTELCTIFGTELPLVLLEAQPDRMHWSVWHRAESTWTPGRIDVRPDPTEQVVLKTAMESASYTDELDSMERRDAQRQLHSLTAERRSVAALHERLVEACAYMERLRHDPTAYDALTLRHLATAVAHRRSATSDARATDDACMDALLATFLASSSKNLHTLHDPPPRVK
ncbi:hypothetical protein MEQU1_001614 [Malassezia equina]|uniref:EIF3F/CSN6-like C-terminal domain-containing protein n=1 Tax=Malassezia equina TaxID=1381935 RepID=A0AAF0ECC6_9BASI|nr:hypothetical protein MEQU1_001614 [Malassezia equina]